MLHEALDGAALAGCIATFEEDRHSLPGLSHPALHLQQFDLQQALLELVLLPGHPFRIRIALAPGVDKPPVRSHQHRIVQILVVGRQTQAAQTAQRVYGPRGLSARGM